MAFCTSCGATVNGTFCSQCGTPASAASAAGSVPPPQAPPVGVPASAMPPQQPVRRGTSPIVWVLVALGGLFLLFIIGVFGIGALVVHKAHQAGISSELLRRNPAAAAARIAAMANPDVDIVSQDDSAGTISLRDRRTGKVVTMSFDQVKSGFRITADGDDGKQAVLEFGGASAAKLPDWVPSYPGANIQGTFRAKGTDSDGQGQGGNFTFSTSDAASNVMSFYQGKAKDLGMKVKLTATAAEGGTMIASDDNDRRMLTIIVGQSSGQTNVNVTYAEKH